MKVALLTDTHVGVRNDAPEFLEMTEKFVSRVFLPHIQKEGIQRVIHLGDIVDRRKYVNYHTANRLRQNILIPITEVADIDLILGNHDVYHRNTNGVNGPTELFGNNSDITIHAGPVETEFGLFLPWITEDNQMESLEAIENSRSPLCFGHLEMEGFEMYRGMVATEGLPVGIFDKFDQVYSGHYHHKSSVADFHYLGSHGEFTWSDWNDERGFHVLDTETRELEFIPNPFRMFEKVFYDGNPELTVDVTGKHVKLIVQKKANQLDYEEFVNRLEAEHPITVTPVDDHLNADEVIDAFEVIDESEDTLAIIRQAVAMAEGNFDTERMTSFMTKLYKEALEIE